MKEWIEIIKKGTKAFFAFWGLFFGITFIIFSIGFLINKEFSESFVCFITSLIFLTPVTKYYKKNLEKDNGKYNGLLEFIGVIFLIQLLKKMWK